MSSEEIDNHNSNVLAALSRGDVQMPSEPVEERYQLKLAQAAKIIGELSGGKTLSPKERLKVMQYFENDTMFARVLLVEFLEG